jgi:ribosome-binding factor A
VEEIINFSEIMEENNINNNKKSEPPNKYLNKKINNKFTPAISFIDDEILKNRKEFNLIKDEENKDKYDNN